MKCQICGKMEASVCMIKMTGDQKDTIYVCPKCIKEMENNIFSEVSNLLNPIFGQAFDFDMLPRGANMCPTCGQTRSLWEEERKMGCKDCYNHFHPITKNQHIGKIPKKNKQYLYILNLISEKERKLQEFIKEESYEKAALLRDEIKNLKKGMNDEN